MFDYARIVEYEDEKALWGIINKKGKLVVPCIFDHIAFISNSEELIKVSFKGKKGFIDKCGNLVIPCVYDDAWEFGKHSLAKVKAGSKWGYVNKEGKNIIPCIYDDIGSFNDGLAFVEVCGKIGYIDEFGKMVVACIYDKVEKKIQGNYDNIVMGYFSSDFSNGYAIVMTNGKCGYINTKGEEVIPCIYQKAGKFSKQLHIRKRERYEVAVVRLDDAYQLIDKMGNIIPVKERIGGGRYFEIGFTKQEYHYEPYEDWDYERETWDALTDGMYGDYPEDGVDWDSLRVSMGRD